MERSKRKTDKILERHKAAMNSKMEEFMKKIKQEHEAMNKRIQDAHPPQLAPMP